MALNEPKFLQQKVNKVMKKSARFSHNPFARGGESDDSDNEKNPDDDDHKAKMEEGGFTMVIPESEGASKGRGNDGFNTVQGISQEEAEEIYKQ